MLLWVNVCCALMQCMNGMLIVADASLQTMFVAYVRLLSMNFTFVATDT